MPPKRLKLLGGTTINIRKHKLTRYLFNWTNPQTLLFSFFLYILEFPSPPLSLSLIFILRCLDTVKVFHCVVIQSNPTFPSQFGGHGQHTT